MCGLEKPGVRVCMHTVWWREGSLGHIESDWRGEEWGMIVHIVKTKCCSYMCVNRPPKDRAKAGSLVTTGSAVANRLFLAQIKNRTAILVLDMKISQKPA